MIKYLTIAGVAKRARLSPHTVKAYHLAGTLPPPDAVTGDGPGAKYGWLPETIDVWNAARNTKPGRPRKNT